MATQIELSTWLGVTDRQIRNLESAGNIPGKRGRAGYDIQECVLSYIRYLQGNQKKGTKTLDPGTEYDPTDPDEINGINIGFEEARHSKLRNDKLDLQIGELERKLAAIELIALTLATASAAAAAILDTIPGNLKRRNPKLTAKDLELAKSEIVKAMNAIARTELPTDYYKGLSDSS
jgi:phage terminase Nu1 subunit (DNA packaging protein)